MLSNPATTNAVTRGLVMATHGALFASRKVKMLVKIHRVLGAAALRTETITGTLLVAGTYPIESRLPEVGEQPVVYNKNPIEINLGQDSRMFNTSPIISYHDTDGGRQIITESGSIYFLEPLDDDT